MQLIQHLIERELTYDKESPTNSLIISGMKNGIRSGSTTGMETDSLIEERRAVK
jgi:hypothetical protein